MSKQYLILIEQLVREGRSEREIDRIISKLVAADQRAELIKADADPDELDRAA